MSAPAPSLRSEAPRRAFDGFGRAVGAASPFVRPTSEAELVAALVRAAEERLPVAFRGSGRSYGDLALNGAGLIVDMRGMNRMLSWNPVTGTAEVQGGLTIEGLWRRTLQDGFWPHVVSGTMFPTMGGCLSANIHGKNNRRAGPFGEHVIEFDLVTPTGEKLTVQRERDAELFHTIVGGLGLFGAITRVKLKLKKVHGGYVRVHPRTHANLRAMLDDFEARAEHADYIVGWVDMFAGGASAGRGVVHEANYLSPGEDPDPERSLAVENQGLPPTIMGVPRSWVRRFMQPFLSDIGGAFINAAKYHSTPLTHPNGSSYLQGHVAYAFLLDYVPEWRRAYGPDGFVQYQVFVPAANAHAVFTDLIERCRRAGIVAYLGVLKKHRPDRFLLSHAVDGYSLALDFAAPRYRRADLARLVGDISDRVIDAGGRFYFAKDALLRPADARRAWGDATLSKLFALKAKLDPDGILQSDLIRRVFPDRVPALLPGGGA